MMDSIANDGIPVNPQLTKIEQSDLDAGQKFRAALRGWSAIDTVIGAHLTSQRNGRGWILIIPRTPPDDPLEPGDDWDRRRFRADSEAEAIAVGNQKLAAWLAVTR